MYKIININVDDIVSIVVDKTTYFSNGVILNIENEPVTENKGIYFIKEDKNKISLFFEKILIDLNDEEKIITFKKDVKLEFEYIKNEKLISIGKDSKLIDKIISRKEVSYRDSYLKRHKALSMIILDFLYRVSKDLGFSDKIFGDLNIVDLDVFLTSLLNILNSRSISVLNFMINYGLEGSLEELLNDNELLIGKYMISSSQRKSLFKLINLLKKLNYSISIKTLLPIVNNFNGDEIELVCKFVEVHNEVNERFCLDSSFKTKDLTNILECIADINGYLKDLTGFLNYYMKLLFKESYIKVSDKVNFSDVLYTYLDYIRLYNICEEYNLDILNYSLYPKNITLEHDNLSLIVNENISNLNVSKSMKSLEEERKMNELFKNMVSSYKYLEYKGEKYSIVAPNSYLDLKVEGEKLSHCIAGYKYAVIKGSSKILFVRKTDDIDTPYYTLEVRGNKVWQLRGYDNKNPNSYITDFVLEWSKINMLNTEDLNKYGL